MTSSNRKIRSDGNVEIESSATSVSGTLEVTGQTTISGLAYPTSDGSANQVLTTNGSNTLSFATISGGFDEIASNSAAGSYSGTARIIYISASEAVVFTSALSDRIIINKNDYEVKFQADVTNCIIQSDNNIEVENNSTDTSTDLNFDHNKVTCANLEINASGDMPGNDITVRNCEIFCEGNLSFASVSTSSANYFFIKNSVYCGGTFDSNSTAVSVSVNKSALNVFKLEGKINLETGDGESSIIARDGMSGASSSLTIQGDSYISGVFAHPFAANYEGVNTNILSRVKLSGSQTITTGDFTKVEFDTETFDNVGCFDTSTNRFTSKVRGHYKISGGIGASAIDTDSTVSAVIYKNGSLYSSLYMGATFANSAARGGTVNDIVELGVGDYIELFLASSHSGENYTVVTISHLNIEKVN